jgi:RNA polymerase sigma factor for flagellar operon FliA
MKPNAKTARPSTNPDPLALVLAKESESIAFGALISLPPSEKRVLTMHYFEDRSLASIAAELGLTETRVDQIRRLGLLLLRDRLDASSENEDVDPRQMDE